jgi:hypothetical protein
MNEMITCLHVKRLVFIVEVGGSDEAARTA